jgi:hypothetical protein
LIHDYAWLHWIERERERERERSGEDTDPLDQSDDHHKDEGHQENESEAYRIVTDLFQRVTHLILLCSYSLQQC